MYYVNLKPSSELMKKTRAALQIIFKRNVLNYLWRSITSFQVKALSQT